MIRPVRTLVPAARLARTGVELGRLAAAVAAAPVRVGGAVLDSPRAARRDPVSAELARRRRDGWRPTEVRLGRGHTRVALERDGERDAVEGATLAFAAYAVTAADGAPVSRDRS